MRSVSPYNLNRVDAQAALDEVRNNMHEVFQGASPVTAAAINNLWVTLAYLTQQYHSNPVLQVVQRMEDSQC